MSAPVTLGEAVSSLADHFCLLRVEQVVARSGRSADTLPPYGSDAYLELDDLGKAAVEALAAFAHGSEAGIARTLQGQLDAERTLAEKRAADAAYVDGIAAHRERWSDEIQRAPGRYAESNARFLADLERKR